MRGIIMDRIMFVIGQMSNGGAERVVSILANELCDRYVVSVVCPIKDELVYDLDPRIHYYGNGQNTDNKINRIRQHYAFISDCCAKEKPEAIISFTTEINLYCCVYKLLHKKTRVILSERNDPARDPRSSLKRRMRNYLYPAADGYVFQTQYAKDYFPDKIKSRGTVIVNPVSGNLPDYVEGEPKKKIVSISRLQKQKNIPLMIDAFEQFHQTHGDYVLEIFGDGVEKENIERIIKDKDLSACVKLMGFRDNVHELISDAAMFLLTSDYEGMSNAMIESLCIGIPTICTDCPAYGARDLIVDGENAFLVKVGDLDALVKKMNALADDPSLARQFSVKSRQIRDRLSAKSISMKWKEIIENE